MQVLRVDWPVYPRRAEHNTVGEGGNRRWAETRQRGAKQQGTRSFQLRAALSLAKLYQSTGRAADAHAVLAPALEGFAPTDEMPEIAEAQALLLAVEASAHARHQ